MAIEIMLTETSIKHYGYRQTDTSSIIQCKVMKDFLHLYAMVLCRSHDTAGSLAHRFFYIHTHWQNADPLAKSRPTGKIQTHWLGHKVVHIVTRNINNLTFVFINILFIYINLIKPWHKNQTV